MKIRINKSAITQYLLIYLMFIIPGSCLFAKYWTGTMKYYVLLIVYAALIAFKNKYRSRYSICFLLLLLFFTVFSRLLVGGVGLSAWCQFAVCILSTQIAICCDRENFLNRWIQTVEFFAAISIGFWAVFYIAPNLVNLWPAQSYDTQALGTAGWETYWHGKGVLLYSYLEIHPTRNCGIFTEPGVYQIVLNMALFVLLFWKDKLSFAAERQYRRCLNIILIGIITAQSTTGYLGLVLILFFFYFTHQEHEVSRVKFYLMGLVFIALVVLFVDYAIRANDSILYKQIIEKLFGSSGSGFDVSSGTGQYRLGTMIVSLATVFQHPLGVGYDAFYAARNAFGSGLVAASLLAYAAVYGIIPWLIVLGMIFTPVFRYQRRAVAFLYVLLFVNTTLAQTDLIYPAFFMIPMYLVATKNMRR